MHLVTRETTLVGFKSLPLNWSSWQSTERIEPFELQAAVITEKFVQTRNLEHHERFIIAALNARTLTSRAPHTSYQPLNSWKSVLTSLKNSTRVKTIRRGKERDVSKSEESPPNNFVQRASFNNPGGFLLSHAVARAVPSAPRGLTSVFGMGTGVTLSTQPAENLFKTRLDPATSNQRTSDPSPRRNTLVAAPHGCVLR